MTGGPTLDDVAVDKLVGLIKDSFRTRPNHDPVYVDIGGHYERIKAPQHQVVFGRRGSGKSCLLVHFKNHANKVDVHPIYIDTDEIKLLGYPDILIRLLLSVLEGLPKPKHAWRDRLLRRTTSRQALQDELRQLLDAPDESQVTTESREESGRTAEVGAAKGGLSGRMGEQSNRNQGRIATFREEKLETLQRHLQDYKAAVRASCDASKHRHVAILIDDFYLIHPSLQPDVLDYMHRLCRGTDAYLKIGTVRHRTKTVRYEGGQTIGVELAQDIEPIDLDHTLEDLDRTRGYLAELLDSLGRQAGIESASTQCCSPDGLFHLCLASGGVPRDFLNVFVEAVEAARATGKTLHLTPKTVYKGAGRVSYRTKLSNLRGDAGPDAETIESLFGDLLDFCLKEKRKTAFLVSQDEAVRHETAHDIIRQLMDFKLIHVIEPDTSAASGRPGRYEAYTLDFALFMEPRRRNIDVVEFWQIDTNRRRQGLREAPTYPLDRALSAAHRQTPVDPQSVIDELDSADQPSLPFLDDDREPF